MLNIVSSTDHSEYSCSPQPIVSVTHKFTNDQLAELLRIAVATMGEDFVASILGPKAPRGTDYMVFVEGGSNPRMVHTSYAAAKAEAERLAKRTARKATVLKIVARVEVQHRQPDVVTHEYK